MLRGIELRSGVKGVFKISVDGTIVYDKALTGHLPTSTEAAQAVEDQLGPRQNWRKG